MACGPPEMFPGALVVSRREFPSPISRSARRLSGRGPAAEAPGPELDAALGRGRGWWLRLGRTHARLALLRRCRLLCLARRASRRLCGATDERGLGSIRLDHPGL